MAMEELRKDRNRREVTVGSSGGRGGLSDEVLSLVGSSLVGLALVFVSIIPSLSPSFFLFLGRGGPPKVSSGWQPGGPTARRAKMRRGAISRIVN